MATLMQANRNWATRPADQRFTSLLDLRNATAARKSRSSQRVLSSRSFLAAPVENDPKRLALVGPSGNMVAPTHWAFGQIASLAGVPADYARRIPAHLAADNINYGLKSRDIEDVQILLRREEDGGIELAAANGPRYGRVWDGDFADMLVDRFGDGVSGRFTVPGEFGKAVTVTKENTTLFASDRDMFVFLADERNRVEVPNRRDGKPGSLARGFFAWNSEVGSQTIGVATFLFDYVCSNRIVWGASQFNEIRIRHTASAPDKLFDEVQPALQRYAESSTAGITQALEDARAARVDNALDFLMKHRFTRPQAAAIQAAHMADEGRPIETIWDVATGITAHARAVSHQDARIDLERRAGDILDLVA